jgi:release factor glutamine methyltransferase
LAHVLLCSRAQLRVHWTETLDPPQFQRYQELVARRIAHEPVAYLVGHRPFYDVDLAVDRSVLIPRPETEHIIEQALAWAQCRPGPLSICDVGTGSGALAVVLARHLPQACIVAVDISAHALAVAEGNARACGVSESISFVQGDLLSMVEGPFDVIVSNPPYVASLDMAQLERDIRDYEPLLALDGGQDGLNLVRPLLQQAAHQLTIPGLLLIEIDHRQSREAQRLAQDIMPDAMVSIVPDLAGLDRIVRVERLGGSEGGKYV